MNSLKEPSWPLFPYAYGNLCSQKQQDLRASSGHCSADARALAAVGVTKRQQVRVYRDSEIYALYTVSDVPNENVDNVVRLDRGGRLRLASDEEARQPWRKVDGSW